MSVPAPPTRFFDTNNASITPPLDDGWAHLQEGSICRPWMVQVFNLRLSDFVAAPTSLADLAFADHAGIPIENAGDLGAIVGLLTTLPSEVRTTPATHLGHGYSGPPSVHTAGWPDCGVCPQLLGQSPRRGVKRESRLHISALPPAGVYCGL